MEKKAAEGIQALISWFKKIQTPVCLDDLNIPVQDIAGIAKNAVGLAKIWGMPDYTEEKIEEILKLCIQSY